ncbi:MAG: hypothetical protein PGN37_01080 [Mycobacterium kyogaense]|uniref:hypothetical protein n=1 Tax=Mycobacterium kyogaense TaxID=2212479 RepID=UPI002FFB4331
MPQIEPSVLTPEPEVRDFIARKLCVAIDDKVEASGRRRIAVSLERCFPRKHANHLKPGRGYQARCLDASRGNKAPGDLAISGTH